MRTEYATPENDIGSEPDTHIRGTITRGDGRGGTKLEFWLTRPRPRGISVDEWDRLEREKWDRIFGDK